MRIKSSFKIQFKYFKIESVKRETNIINSKKISPKGDKPVKIVKWNCIIMALVLTEGFNQNIKNSKFPNELENADISPVYKKNDRHDLLNYRPVSISRQSKPFERSLYGQIDSYTKDVLPKYQVGF